MTFLSKFETECDLPIDLRKAWVRASVLDISSEKISEPASIVKGVSSPRLFAIPILQKRNIPWLAYLPLNQSEIHELENSAHMDLIKDERSSSSSFRRKILTLGRSYRYLVGHQWGWHGRRFCLPWSCWGWHQRHVLRLAANMKSRLTLIHLQMHSSMWLQSIVKCW